MKRYIPVFKESNQTIVHPDINNGAIVNKLFQIYMNVKNQKQHDAIMDKIKNTKFGTYGTANTVLNIIDTWDKGSANEIVRRDFINSIQYYLKSH